MIYISNALKKKDKMAYGPRPRAALHLSSLRDGATPCEAYLSRSATLVVETDHHNPRVR